MNERSPFRPALVVGLITAGLISFAAFIMLLGWGSGPGDTGSARQSGGRANAASAAATGYKGLVDLADKLVSTRLVEESSDLDQYGLLVVPLSEETEASEVRQLLARRSGRPTILILPKWAVTSDRERPAWVRKRYPSGGYATSDLLGPGNDVRLAENRRGSPRVLEKYGNFHGIGIEVPEAPQVIEGDIIDPLIEIRGEGALVARLGYEPHVVVADPDLLNNQGIDEPENARFAMTLLLDMMPDPDGTISFDLMLSGAARGRNLLRTMFEPPFLAMTLALLAAALLAGIHGAIRFGPARRGTRAIPFGKAALVENSAGLVRLARREVPVGAGYADVVRDDAARSGAAPAHLQGDELEAYLDRFSKPGEPSFRELAYRLRNARDRGQLVAAARALFRWRKDLIR